MMDLSQTNITHVPQQRRRRRQAVAPSPSLTQVKDMSKHEVELALTAVINGGPRPTHSLCVVEIGASEPFFIDETERKLLTMSEDLLPRRVSIT